MSLHVSSQLVSTLTQHSLKFYYLIVKILKKSIIFRPNWKFAFLISVSLILFPWISYALTVQEVPNPQEVRGEWVSDIANILTPRTRTQLNSMISELEAKNGTELAVVTVPETAPSPTPKAFATELFNTWGIGKQGQDNGVLFLISVGDRRVEIETGYGVEGILSDAKVSRIIETQIIPEFRRGDFEAGTLAGTKAIVTELQTESFLPEDPINYLDQTPYLFSSSILVVLAIISYYLARYATHSPQFIQPKDIQGFETDYDSGDKRIYRLLGIASFFLYAASLNLLYAYCLRYDPGLVFWGFMILVPIGIIIPYRSQLPAIIVRSKPNLSQGIFWIILPVLGTIEYFFVNVFTVYAVVMFLSLFTLIMWGHFFPVGLPFYGLTQFLMVSMSRTFGGVTFSLLFAILSAGLISYFLALRLRNLFFSPNQKRHAFRPFHCANCRQPMSQLGIVKLSPLLKAPELVAYELGSTAYEGWWCHQCGDPSLRVGINLRIYTLDPFNFSLCPTCLELTVTQSSNLLVSPTRYRNGIRQIKKICHCCDYTNERDVIIPHLSGWGSGGVSSSSGGSTGGDSFGGGSSGDGGSFGGGSSGGGGAGGSW